MKPGPVSRRGYRVIIPVLCLGASTTALADRGERAVGFDLGGGYPAGGRASISAEEGLSDWVAARLEGGLHISETDGRVNPEALASFGMVVAFDVFAWVPEVYLGAGGAFGEHAIRGRIIARGGVRRYLAMDWSLTFRLVGEWSPRDEWLVLGTVGIRWHLGAAP